MTPDTLPAVMWILLKLFTLLGIAVYAVFAGVMVRQEYLMAHVLEESFEPVLRLLTFIHLALTGVVFLLALVLL
jgi:hypothetical protein